MKAPDVPKLLNAKDVAEIFSVDLSTVYDWARAKTLPSYNFGKNCIRFDPRDLVDFMEMSRRGMPRSVVEKIQKLESVR